MKLRIDYLNADIEARHIFTDDENIWRELKAIIVQRATDIRVYRLPEYQPNTIWVKVN